MVAEELGAAFAVLGLDHLEKLRHASRIVACVVEDLHAFQVCLLLRFARHLQESEPCHVADSLRRNVAVIAKCRLRRDLTDAGEHAALLFCFVMLQVE